MTSGKQIINRFEDFAPPEFGMGTRSKRAAIR